MVTTIPVDRLSPDAALLVDNYHVGFSTKYEQRFGMAILAGGNGSNSPRGLAVFSNAAGVKTLVRFNNTGPMNLAESSWLPYSGGVISSPPSTAFTNVAAWGDSALLATDQTNKILTLDVANRTRNEIPNAPVCMHITVFDNRVIASYITSGGTFPTRIQWSVKDDNTDWSSEGSGYEDLYGTPGGEIDQQMGVYPISDVFALVVRSNSIWGMQISGYFDAPFSFSRMFPGIGTPARQSIATVIGPESQLGVMFVGVDDIYFVTQQGYQKVGTAVRDQIIASGVELANCQAVYDVRNREYILMVPATGQIATATVYRCKTDRFRWTRATYPSAFARMVWGQYNDTTTYPPYGVLIMVYDSGSNYGVRESPTSYQDYNSSGSLVDSATDIDTGFIRNDQNVDTTSGVVDVQLDYTIEQTATVTLASSVDGGTTWITLGSKSLSATSKPSVVAFRAAAQYVLGSSVQLRLTTSVLCGLKVISLRPYVVSGGRIVW